MVSPTYKLIVLSDVLKMQHLAANFKQSKEELISHGLDIPQSTELLERFNDRGWFLRKFQREVIRYVDSYNNVFEDDDVVEELINGQADSELMTVIDVVKEFEDSCPTLKVASLIPFDFEGTVGFVVTEK